MNGRSGVVGAGLVVVVMTIALLGATACTAKEYRPVEVGECLPDGVDVIGIREADPDRVPCSEEHRYEVYARTRVDLGAEWPGEEAVDVAADEACQDQLLAGAGIDRNHPPAGVQILRIQPTEQSWTDRSDRSVECLLSIEPSRRGRLAEGDATRG